MHRYLLPAIVLAAGAIGGFVALSRRDLGPRLAGEPVERTPTMDQVAIERLIGQSLAEVRSDLASIREELSAIRSALRGSSPFAPTGTSTPTISRRPLQQTPTAHVVLERGGQRAYTPAESEAPRKNLDVLSAWSEDSAVRKQWLFVSEEEVLASLGMPDEVEITEQGTEVWRYECEAASEESFAKSLRLQFNTGRLVSAYRDP